MAPQNNPQNRAFNDPPIVEDDISSQAGNEGGAGNETAAAN
jgi:hypothetical protein